MSCAQAVKAILLNGLGFLSAPLYLFEEFFSGKATEHLIGPGIESEHLNDDRLGRGSGTRGASRPDDRRLGGCSSSSRRCTC